MTTTQTPSSVLDLQINDHISFLKDARISHGTVKSVFVISSKMVKVLVELDHPQTINFMGFVQTMTTRMINLTDDDMLKITRPVSIRELYKKTWRNVRCVRSLDHRATLDTLGNLGYDKDVISNMVADVLQQKEDRAYGEFGWVNYFNYIKFNHILDRIHDDKVDPE